MLALLNPIEYRIYPLTQKVNHHATRLAPLIREDDLPVINTPKSSGKIIPNKLKDIPIPVVQFQLGGISIG